MGDSALLQEAANSILNKDMNRAKEIAQQTLEMKLDPMEMLTDGFIKGIAEVGDLFDRGELFLPELTLCSEVMKSAAEILSSGLQSKKMQSSGKVIVATVEGDVHDIGKGIVVSLMTAYGLEVLDLGRDVPAEKIIEKAEDFGADIIGTSALLTTTMERQKQLESILREENLRDKYLTIVGGAPVTQRWAKKIGADVYAENAIGGIKKIFDFLKQKELQN